VGSGRRGVGTVRILIFAPFAPPDLGGIETLVGLTAGSFVEQGHEVLVIAGVGAVTQEGLSLDGPIATHRFDMRQAIATNDLRAVARIKSAVSQLKAEFRADVVQLHISGPEPMFHLMTQAGASIPTVVTVHAEDDRLFREYGEGFVRSVFERADLATSVSVGGTDAFRRWMPSMSDKMRTIANGVVVRDEPAPYQASAPAIMVGRVLEEKAPDVAIAAMTHVLAERPDARLTIVGDGVGMADTVDLARKVGVDAAVDFVGTVPRTDIKGFVDGCSMLVIPSRTEGLPMAALEAASEGRPLVGTQVGGLAALIRDGITGLQVPVDDAEALAHAMLKVWDNPGAAERMGRAAHDMVRNEFSIEACCQQYLSAYEELIGAGA